MTGNKIDILFINIASSLDRLYNDFHGKCTILLDTVQYPHCLYVYLEPKLKKIYKK